MIKNISFYQFFTFTSSEIKIHRYKSKNTSDNDDLDFWIIVEKQNQKWPPTPILPFLIILKKKALIEQSGFASLLNIFFNMKLRSF